MLKSLCVMLFLNASVFSGSQVIPDSCYEYNTLVDLDSNKSYEGNYRYSASGEIPGNLFARAEENVCVNLEINGKPLNPMCFSALNIDEEYRYMGKKCAFLNEGGMRMIICDSGNILYVWETHSNRTRRHMFTNKVRQ